MKQIAKAALTVLYLIAGMFEPSILNIEESKKASFWSVIIKIGLILLAVGLLVWIAQKWYPANKS